MTARDLGSGVGSERRSAADQSTYVASISERIA
jgi:hypothetical protein